MESTYRLRIIENVKEKHLKHYSSIYKLLNIHVFFLVLKHIAAHLTWLKNAHKIEQYFKL